MTKLTLTENTGVTQGLQKLFAAKPELIDAVKQLVETNFDFLHNSNGESADHISICSDCVCQIVEAAREIPELKAWAKQLDDFEETEHAGDAINPIGLNSYKRKHKEEA